MTSPEAGGLGVRLPPELIELIVEQLALSPGPDSPRTTSGRHALAPFMRVSHIFYDIVGPILYSRIVLTRNNADALLYGFKCSESVRKTKYEFEGRKAYQTKFETFSGLWCGAGRVDGDPLEDNEDSDNEDYSEAENVPGYHYADLDRCALHLTGRWQQGKPMPDDCGESGNPFEDCEDSEDTEDFEGSELSDSEGYFGDSEDSDDASESPRDGEEGEDESDEEDMESANQLRSP